MRLAGGVAGWYLVGIFCSNPASPRNDFACHGYSTLVTWAQMARSSTTFRPKWRLGCTTVIRIPEKLAPEVLRYAHELDSKCKPKEIHDGPTAYRTAEDVEMHKPVNVASVPQRSPFRYPGGKTWLVPYIRSWLASKKSAVCILVEPFAGGGIVGLT